MKVPLLDLKSHHEPIQGELLEAVRRIVGTGQFILGPEVVRFEEALADYCGARHAIGVSSGSDALLLCLMALGIGPGDEVVTSPYSFFATAGVVARLGAKPVFADIEPESCNMDPKKIEKALSPKTRALIPVHLYGQCADMAPIIELARKRNIPVIEDAAQAVGAEHPAGRAASMGLAGCLSFFPTKNLGALGDAGAVLTNDPAFAEKARLLRVHGSQPKYYHKLVGGNFRIDALQAALLGVKLKYLDSWTRKRRENAERYRRLFSAGGLVNKGPTLPREVHAAKGLVLPHIYHQFVIRAPRRDALREFLREKEVETEVYYPIPLHLQECFRSLGYKPGDFPEAEKAAAETLALPIYPELSAKQQEYVVESIAKFYR
ncbi:MAG: DegT/DnrJ/EryC1/StrS family aminotransferase [Elusimicrobia bacterium]|nr:DegT/DnrJ/EryC1/StrS family aminotransferase [Elusimicrobiota bacterium]